MGTMRYPRTLRTFSFFLLLLSAVLSLEEQASHNQRSDEGISEGQNAGVMDDTLWQREDAADKEDSCGADDCVDLEADQIFKPSDPDAVFDMPRAARQNGMETDPTGTAKRTEFIQNEDRPSPDKTTLPSLKSTEPPTVAHGAEPPTVAHGVETPTVAHVAEASASPQEAKPGEAHPTYISSTAFEDDVAVKPPTAASESRAEAPAVGGSSEEPQAAQTDGPGPLYPTPQSTEAAIPHQEKTAASVKDERDRPSRTAEQESELVDSKPDKSLSLDRSELSDSTQEKLYETTESEVIIDTSEPPTPIHEPPTQSLKATTREFSTTAAGMSTPSETPPPEAVSEPDRPQQSVAESPARTEPAPEESEPTTQPEESEPTTQPEEISDFEPEEQLSFNDSDTTQEVTTEPTVVPRRQSPKEPVRVGLPRVEGEKEEAVEKDDDGEVFEQVRSPKVTFVPDLSPKMLKPYRLQNSSWFVMFYAPWCPHSQAALPVVLDIFQYIVDHNISVYIGKLDVSKYGEALKQFRVKATPTFLFYQNTVRHELVDDVSFENLKNFMSAVLTAEVTEVNTSRQLSELRKVHPVLFLLVHDGERDKDWHSTYTKVAMDKALKGRFCYTTEPGIVEDLGVSRTPSIVVIKDGKAHRFSESLSAYGLSRWVASERYVEFPTANATTLRQFIRATGGRRLAVLAVHDDPAQRRIAQKKAIEVVKKVALSRKLHSHFQFVLLESIEMAEKMQQGSVDLPALYAYELHTGYYYPYEPGEGGKGMTEESVIKFFRDVSKKRIEHRGGPSYTNTFKMWWWWLYGTFHTTITHHPVISAIALFSVVGVVIFYLTICCRRSPKKLKRPLKGRRLQAASRQQPRQNTMNSSSQARKRKHDQTDEGSEPSGSESQSHSEAESPKDK